MNKYILCVSVSLCLLMSSCLNDEFLEVYPKGQQTEASVFTTYDNFKTIHGDCITCSSDIRMIQGKRMKFSVVILNRIT